MNEAVFLRLKRATGLDLSRVAVNGAVRRRMKDCATADHEAYTHQVLHDDDELNALIDQVVVPETWFFRDAEAFTAAVAFVQQKLAAARQAPPRPLRLLSIPCASGEEPGSLAMALLDAGVGAHAFTIEAVDVSRQVIERARRGLYHRNAFRTADLAFRDRHFSKSAEGYTLSAAVRAQVQTYCGNLLTLDQPPPGQAFDLIFCRNLLIYFDAATQGAAIRKLHTLLADDGLLFAGYAEVATFCRHGFASAPLPKAFALKKKRDEEAAGPQLARRPKPRMPCAPVVAASMLTPAAASARASSQAPTPVSAATSAEPSEALLQQAGRLADAGKPDEACANYLAYLNIDPESVEAYFMLGLLSEHANASAAAEAYLRRAVYLDPGHYEALCHLALLTERGGHAREADVFRQRAARVFGRRPTPSTQANP